MKISVITATVSGDASLDYTLASVAGQTHPDIEHLVVDGSDSGKTAEIVASYPGVKILKRPRKGVYDALNFGIHNTTGDVFGFLHCNDALASPEILATIARAFDEDPDLDFVYGNLRYVSPTTHAPGRIYHAEAFEPSHLIGGHLPPHPTLYIRRSAAERVGDYDESYHGGADFDMWVRLFKDKSLKYKYLPCIMVNMATGGLSTKLKSRLYLNNIDKLRSLRRNGLPANPIRLMSKYLQVVKDFLLDFVNGK